MMILDKTFEIHCNRDADNPDKTVSWYVIGSFNNKFEVDRYWKQMACTKRTGYRKVEITREMKVIK